MVDMIVDGERVPVSEAIADVLARVPAEMQRRIPKLLIVDRLIASGQAQAAMAALSAQPLLKMRWDAAGDILSDDPIVREFLTSAGLDPDVVLAAP